MERGKARSYLIAAGSNTVVKRSPGSLYGVHATGVNGGSIRLENGELGAALDLYSVNSNTTIGIIGTFAAATPYSVTFTPGIGFDTLHVGASSNVRFTVAYE